MLYKTGSCVGWWSIRVLYLFDFDFAEILNLYVREVETFGQTPSFVQVNLV